MVNSPCTHWVIDPLPLVSGTTRWAPKQGKWPREVFPMIGATSQTLSTKMIRTQQHKIKCKNLFICVLYDYKHHCQVLDRLFQIRERSVPWFTPLFQKSRLVGFLSEPNYQLHRGKWAFLHAGRLTCWVHWIDLRVSSVMFERIQLLVYTRLMPEVMFPKT